MELIFLFYLTIIGLIVLIVYAQNQYNEIETLNFYNKHSIKTSKENNK